MLMEKTTALAQRTARKAKKPVFTRQDAHKRVKLASGWRKPRGYQSKMRLGRRGYKRAVSDGYGSPRSVEGLHKSGLKPVIVATVAELDKLSKHDGAVLVGGLGAKKKALLIKHAQEKKITLLNVKDAATALASIDEKFRARKTERTAATAKKSEKAKAKKPKLEEKAASDDEKKEALEEEKQKVLNQKV